MSDSKLISIRSVLTVSVVSFGAMSGFLCAPAHAQSGRETAPVEFRSAAQHSQYRVPTPNEYAPVSQGSPLEKPNVEYYEKVAKTREQTELKRQAAERASKQAQQQTQQQVQQRTTYQAQQQATQQGQQQFQYQAQQQMSGQAQSVASQQNPQIFQQGVAQSRNGYASTPYGHGSPKTVPQTLYEAPSQNIQAAINQYPAGQTPNFQTPQAQIPQTQINVPQMGYQGRNIPPMSTPEMAMNMPSTNIPAMNVPAATIPSTNIPGSVPVEFGNAVSKVASNSDLTKYASQAASNTGSVVKSAAQISATAATVQTMNSAAPAAAGTAIGVAGSLLGKGFSALKGKKDRSSQRTDFSNEDLMSMREHAGYKSLDYENAQSEFQPSQRPQNQPPQQFRQAIANQAGIEHRAAAQRPLTQQPISIAQQPHMKQAPMGYGVQVLPGDTLFSLSERYRVALRALVETNNLQPPFALEVGSFIQLPPPNIHVVEAGETLYAISRRYNVDTRSLANMNALPKPWTIYPGDEILLPSLARDVMASEATAIASAKAQEIALAKSTGIAAPMVGHVATVASPSTQMVAVNKVPTELAVDAAKLAKRNTSLGRFDEAAPTKATKIVKSVDLPGKAKGFVWPLQGNLIRKFGALPDGKKSDGLNIAARSGASIKAISDGYVVYAGSELPGFGHLILINHGGGWVSAYAHAKELLVEEGQAILQGQEIARVGETGSVDSPQLHFQLRKGKSPIDPTGHLTGKQPI